MTSCCQVPVPSSRRARGAAGWRVLSILAALAIHPAAGWTAEAIGVATVAEGEARLIRGTDLFALAPGVDVASGDVVTTGAGSRVQLEMEDGTILEAGPSSQLHLAEYRLREDRSVADAAVALVTGWLRFVTAKLRPESRYRFDTNTATIGIRGTEGTLEAAADETRFALTEGRVEAYEVDNAGNLGDAISMTGGQYLHRKRARPAVRLAAPPAAFRDRMPRHLRRRPGRHMARMARRGIAPRKLRAVGYEDVKTLLEANPRIRKRLEKRFESRRPEPAAHERMHKPHRQRATAKERTRRAEKATRTERGPQRTKKPAAVERGPRRAKPPARTERRHRRERRR